MSTREERFSRIDAAVMNTITGDDWRRSIAWVRSAAGRRNAVREQIQRKILDLRLGNSESGSIGKSSK